MMIRRIIYGLFLLGSLYACSGTSEAIKEPHSEEELSGLTLATTKGNFYHNKFSTREDINLFVANTEADGVQALRQGIADVYVGDDIMLSSDEMGALGLKMAFRGEESFDVAFALRKGNDALRDSLNAFILSAPLQRIKAHWIDGSPEAEEDEYVISPDAEPLRCVSAVNLSPVCFVGEGGEWIGMDPDILRRFAHTQGREIEISFQDMGSAILALQTGQADIMSACLYVTEERQKVVDFSLPYHACHPGYFMLDRGSKASSALGERIRTNLVKDKRWKLITDGLLETVRITLFSILLGTVLGIGVCACRRSRRKSLRSLASLYGAFISGIPTLVLLLIMFYVVFVGFNASFVAIVTFALCFASASGTIFDTSISSVPRGQTEAGLSLGFTPFRTFTGIVLPQALRKGLPLFAGECVSLLKETSIVGYIAIQDVTRASDLIRSRTFDAFIPLLIVTLIYFVLAWILRRLLNLFLLKK